MEWPVLSGCSEWMSAAVSCVTCPLPYQLTGRLPLLLSEFHGLTTLPELGQLGEEAGLDA